MTVTDIDSVVLLTLLAATALLDAGPVMTRGGRLLSIRGAFSIRSLTAGDGPFLYGIVDKALSLVELSEYLDIDGPVQPSAVPEREHAARGSLVRTLGVLAPSGDGTQASDFLNNASLKGLKFSEETTGWNYWILNLGKNMTTGATYQRAVQLFVDFNPSG